MSKTLDIFRTGGGWTLWSSCPKPVMWFSGYKYPNLRFAVLEINCVRQTNVLRLSSSTWRRTHNFLYIIVGLLYIKKLFIFFLFFPFAGHLGNFSFFKLIFCISRWITQLIPWLTQFELGWPWLTSTDPSWPWLTLTDPGRPAEHKAHDELTDWLVDWLTDWLINLLID